MKKILSFIKQVFSPKLKTDPYRGFFMALRNLDVPDAFGDDIEYNEEPMETLKRVQVALIKSKRKA